MVRVMHIKSMYRGKNLVLLTRNFGGVNTTRLKITQARAINGLLEVKVGGKQSLIGTSNPIQGNVNQHQGRILRNIPV